MADLPELTKEHFVNLRDGKFDSTTKADLDNLFKAYAASERKSLAVHFHGGLVDEKSGMAIARRLQIDYGDAGAFPVFFVWESGPLEVIRNNLREIFDERIFKRILQIVSQFAIGKLSQHADARGTRVPLPDPNRVKDELNKPANNREPYARLDPTALPEDAKLEPEEEKQLKELTESDAVLRQEAIAIMNSLRTPEEIAAAEKEGRARGVGVQGSAHTLMSPAVLEQARKEIPEQGARGLLVPTWVIKAVVATGARVIRRFAARRDHGFYVTIVEEILRELYVANVGEIYWGAIKKDTADGFGEDVTLYGGTAFLEGIKTLPKPRIVLIGHSTGAIYICHLIKHAAARLPADVTFDVIFLAPACDFDLFADTLRSFGDRISQFRLFGMQDAREQADQMVPIVYPRSLLYFVSGICEDEPDKPLVGMRRYYSGEKPYDAEAIKQVREFIQADPTRAVWSLEDSGDGRRSNSEHHGDFDNDGDTLASLRHIIASGHPA